MNQRASHFSLGSTSVQYGSVYAKDFVPKQSNKQQPNGQNPFRGTSLQGNKQKSSFQTTNKALMQNWGNVQQAKLDPEKLKNLRSHHFTLGNYNPGSLNTSHKMFYDRKHINNEASNKQQESKTKMRMHNHDFKQQNWTNFQSSYVSQYGAHQGGNQNSHNPVKQQTGNSIVLGNHKIPMVTTNTLDYSKKQLIANQYQGGSKPSLQQTSALVLGDNRSQQPMQTLNQHYYTSKPIQPNKLPQATMKQLRSTHFNLGSMKQSYNTESKLYQSFSNAPTNNKFEIPSYESGTWVDKDAKFNAQTTNQRQLPQRDGQPYKKHQNSIKGGFQLGAFKNSYQTQSGKNYVERLTNERVQNAKKQDNIVIGLDKGSYLTEQRANFKNRDLKQAKSDNTSIKAMNTQDHFKIGGNSNQAQLSTYQDEYRKDIENKNKMFHNQKK